MRTEPRREDYTNWEGEPLSDAQWADHLRMPRCRWCGQTVNYPPKEERPGQQTVAEIRRLLGPCNYIRTFGGWIDADCWLEHHQPFLKYVRLERRNMPDGPALVETAYPGDRGAGAFGIYPIAAKEYAL
jgi:hypothetical protein